MHLQLLISDFNYIQFYNMENLDLPQNKERIAI